MIPSRRCVVLVLAFVAALAIVRVPTAAAAPPPTLAAVVLIDGSRSFMGNDAYARAETCRTPPPGKPCRIVKITPGAHPQVVAALGTGKQALGALLGRDAKAALMTYGMTPRVLVPMGAARRLTGKRLGRQQAFAGEATHDLAAGLEAALAMVSKVEAARRVVLVIGSGAVRSPRAEELKARFVAAGVAVIYLELHADPDLVPYDAAQAAQLAAVLGSGDDGSHAVALADAAALPAALRAAVARALAP